MNNFGKVLVLGACLQLSGIAYSYEINNHADMSQTALQLSKLGTTSGTTGKLRQLGLKDLDVFSKRQLFPLVPVAGTLPEIRYCFGEYLPGGIAREYEKSASSSLRFQDPGIEQPDWAGRTFTIAQVFRYGSCFEDSESPFSRPLTHFYNVQSNGDGTPRVPPAVGRNANSLKWSLQRGNSNTDTGTNHYTWQDARNAFYYALTGRNLDEQNPITDARREAAWARTFQALGHVMHHLQDMASPQHVRGDYHCNDEEKCGSRLGSLLGLYRPSGYEYYFDQRFQLIRSLAASATTPLMFGLPREFWNMNTNNILETSSPSGVMQSNQGIAAYAATNFVSAGTDFRINPLGNAVVPIPTAGQPLPRPSGTFNNVSVTDLFPATSLESVRAVLCGGDLSKCSIRFMGTQQDPSAKSSSMSTFSQELLRPAGTYGGNGAFQQNFFTYTDAATKLVPLVTRYSAGLIDYFFRGELKLEPTSDGVFGVLDHSVDTGFKKLVVRVTNTTPAIADAASNTAKPQPMNGEFVAVVRYYPDRVYNNNLTSAIGLGGCATLAAIYGAGNEPYDANGNANPNHDPARTTTCRDGVERIAVSSPTVATALAPNETKELSFDFASSPVPLAGVDYSLQVVFKGQLGDELDAVATGVRTLTDPMFFTRHNVYDLIMSDYRPVTSFFGSYFGLEPDVRPTPPGFFVSANTRMFDLPPYPDLFGHGYQCWSLFGLSAFKCYDYARTQDYSYTAGPRTQARLVAASGVAPGRYTRIALLAPLEDDSGQLKEAPMLRIERQRDVPGPFTGETVSAVVRHARSRIAWPLAMRDVNSWHSDGYVWNIGTSPNNPRTEYRYSVRDNYCFVFPKNQLLGTNTKSMQEINSTVAELASDTVQLNTNASYRLTSSRAAGTPSYYAPVTYNCTTQTYAQIAANGQVALGVEVQGETNLFVTTYSPWDLYLSTTKYSVFENPPAIAAAFQPIEHHVPYLRLAKMKQNGITSALIAAQGPAPVSVAAKYR